MVSNGKKILHLYSYFIIPIILQVEPQDYWKRLSSALFTGLFVCSMKINFLHVISPLKIMVKLLIRGAFQEKWVFTCFVSKFAYRGIWAILIWSLSPPALSTNEMYLYEICYSVSSRIVSGSNTKYARWLTTANRV